MGTSRAMDRRTDETRSAIIDAAERLFAENGIAAVPLRVISATAGQRNHSAAQYHFESRIGLVEAIIASRSRAVDARRRVLLEELAAAPADDEGRLRRLVEVLVDPWVDCLAEPGESYYLRFLARCMDDPELRASWRGVHLEPDAVRDATLGLKGLLGHLDAETARRRIEWVAAVSLRTLADEERRGTTDPAELGAVREDLVGMLTALLAL